MRELDWDDLVEVNRILKERHPLYYSNLRLMDLFPWFGKFRLFGYNPKQEFDPKSISRKVGSRYASSNEDSKEILDDDTNLELKLAEDSKELDSKLFDFAVAPKTAEDDKEDRISEIGTRFLLSSSRERSDDSAHTNSFMSSGILKNLKEKIENAEALENSKNAKNKNFTELGFGWYAFFVILEWLIILFSILSVISLLNIALYFYLGDSKTSNIPLDFIELGNIGYASSMCKNIELGIGTLTLVWTSGQISHIESYGIMPSTAKYLDTCISNKDTQKCESLYDSSMVLQDIENKCMNKRSWTLNVNEYIKGNTEHQTWLDETASFYVQAFCYYPDEEIERRGRLSLILTIQVIIVVIIYLIFMCLMNNNLIDKYEEWDMNTTTISDYVLEYPIPKGLYMDFVNSEYKENPIEYAGDTEVFAFK